MSVIMSAMTVPWTCSSVSDCPARLTRCPLFNSRRQVRPRRWCLGSPAASSSDGQQLASEFARTVNEAGLVLSPRRPSHMLPPHAVVQAQMEALQHNDWPDGEDSGVRVAFAFTKPHDAEDFTPLSVPSHVRSWGAKEEWLDWQQFQQMLHAPPYSVLLDCASWQPASSLVFPSKRHENKAVMAVQVTAAPQRAAQQSEQAKQQQRRQQQQGGSLRQYAFTFCLERVERGPYKGCWLTVGVREGDYAH